MVRRRRGLVRRRRGLVRLLVGLLLLQWAGAVLPHARAMARVASAQLVEICTHAGTQRVMLGEDGRPIEAERDADCCVLCLGPAAPIRSEPPALPLPGGHALVAEPFRREGAPPGPPRAPPQQPRAPPLS